MRYRIFAMAAGLALLFLPFNKLGADGSRLRIQAPPYSRVQVDGAPVPGNSKTGQFDLFLPAESPRLLHLEIRGPLGGIVTQEISVSDQDQTLKIVPGIIQDPNPNPPLLATLPALCPRLRLLAVEGGVPRYSYDGNSDPLNQVPVTQMSDPDAWEGEQSRT